MRPVTLCVLFGFALAACGVETREDRPNGGAAEPSDGDDAAPAGTSSADGIGTTPGRAPPRPAPQATVRDCGRRLSAPVPLSTYTQWVSFKRTQIGARLTPMASRTAAYGARWAGGDASRIATAAVRTMVAGPDVEVDDVRSALGLREPAELWENEYFNEASGPNGKQARLFYSGPATHILTFASAWSQRETGWTINAPSRTPAASNIGSDLFARGLVAARFFGVAVVLMMPDTCAVGALGDALGAPPRLRGANPDSGIFHPATMDAAQAVLVKNGAKLMVRVTSNKRSARVEGALATTTCSPGDLAACKSLLAELEAASTAFARSAPSDLAKLEEGTDPTWSTVEVVAAPVSILSP